MKRLYILFVFSLLASASFAQLDRTKMPEAGPAPEIRFGDAASFTLDNGLKVFVIQNQKLPRVTYSLILDRDPILEGDKSGMLSFVGEMLTAGTKNRSKDKFNEEIDFLGASISASSTSISASTLTKHQEKVLELMADVLYNPVFPEEELQKLKTQAKSGLASAKSDPSSISSVLTSKLVYGTDHPYGENETEQTVDNVTIEDIKNYYNTFFRPNIAYLAIVGDVNMDQAKTLVNKHFAQWKQADVPKFKYPIPQPPAKNVVALVDRPSAQQSVVNITYPIQNHLPSPDYLASQVAGYILGGGGSSRMFMNLREDKGYTYGAYARIGSNSLVASFSANASVRGAATDSAVNEMIYEIRNMRENGITQTELDAAKANLSGSFGRSLESPATIANFAINIERYNLPKDYYATYLQRLGALTVEDVNVAAKKFLKPDNMYITVVGNGSVQESLLAFGEVQRFTTSGDPEKQIAMDEGMTAEEVLSRFYDAVGGEAVIRNIKTAKIESIAEMPGMTLGMNFYYDENIGAYSNKVIVGGGVMSNTVMKDGKMSVTVQGQSQTLPEEQYEAAKLSMFIFPELHFENLGYGMVLDGIKDVDGQNAYKLTVMNESGISTDYYYSVESGLRIKTDGQASGEIAYSKYKEFNGVKYPMQMVIKSPMIPMPLSSEIKKVEFNKALDKNTFN
ncbi:Predicted Zn-dependent peptidase [Belliella buryatensis]|uniref:Predicted Zn-dependent peptidase n=1 Tax=Belliella buryatensis TaxID=1500549 RepID=A0A239GTX1_9BACT|nr:pitrilysin family protein [Belliella buryatensis]SNS72228.1 Predicted Zn-dependent peptidase [Belliella buryatensis]